MKKPDEKGRVTLPAQEGLEEQIKELIPRWGVDAIRDSDGTKLSEEVKSLTDCLYGKCFLTRGDNQWTENHPDHRQQMFLMSQPKVATADSLVIDPMEGYFAKQFRLNETKESLQYWQVYNRSTGQLLSREFWDYNPESQQVTISNPRKWHRYTVNFLVDQIWDPIHMYNSITNHWDTAPHQLFDPRPEETKEHMLDNLRQWLSEREDISVVRLTTFFYNFTLVFNALGKEKYVDWFGYNASVSIKALEDFKEEYGYALTAEDFIDEGYYNTPFRLPKKRFLDWLDFQQRFVAELGRACVELIHEKGKEAMMFLGDHWAGTEPYGPYFHKFGLDAVVGSVGNGTTCRMISDIPHVKYTEGRMLPYFFPDVFCETGDPVGELDTVWLQARRAILRSPLDRIGFGGYLGLALEHPDFLKRVEEITQEFRDIHQISQGEKPYKAPIKVGILNVWGSLRSWMANQVAHALYHKKINSYVGILEALSGMEVEVSFINFEDIKGKNLKDLDVIINWGEAGTSWSGGYHWLDQEVVTTLREWVHNGGGFIGVGEPTACEQGGYYFQLADVLGVDRDNGCHLNTDHYDTVESDHFITEDLKGVTVDYGEAIRSVYGVSEQVQILDMDQEDVLLAANTYGKGRAVYIAGLPYDAHNTRLLLRGLYWSCHKEALYNKWRSTNPYTECVVYVDRGYLGVINNSQYTQKTTIYGDGKSYEVLLKSKEMKWIVL